jgi:hypothetical protein
MQDVRVVPKIMGPIEELQFLDLINFRRLGKTPEEITTKIFNKVKMLERDGYEKMITGITVWKKSPVSLVIFTDSTRSDCCWHYLTASDFCSSKSKSRIFRYG